MYQLFLLIHLIICISLVGLILIQQGKGAEMGATFGAGASQTVFGSQGTGSFLLKLTGGLGLLFFVSSLFLGHLVAKDINQNRDIMIPASSQSKTQGSPPETPKPVHPSNTHSPNTK